MCGIVGAAARQDVTSALLEGLKRLEYRGYDSAGIAVLNDHGLQRLRCNGKVAELVQETESTGLSGQVGIAHTRWATHGAPSDRNAHPHVAGMDGRIAVVHNGIIENHAALRKQQQDRGIAHDSDTDSEILACQIAGHLSAQNGLLDAVRAAVDEVEGSFAFGVIDREDPERIIGARRGSPLVVGHGDSGYYLASDPLALAEVSSQYCLLQNGDIVMISEGEAVVWNGSETVVREWREFQGTEVQSGLGDYEHHMQKEIFEQPDAVAQTLEGRIETGRVDDGILGPDAGTVLDATRAVQIAACGTSYHAALVARHWLERHAGIHCQVEIASEFRYRQHAQDPGTLFIAISQSGETADTLAALEMANQDPNYHATLAICNVAHSSMVQESDLTLLTHAGPEIGVASTKAFVTQLTALMLVVILLGRRRTLAPEAESDLVAQLANLPTRIGRVLELDAGIAALSKQFANRHHALFLGRGSHYPIAMEGALKLKEISYIHAEAYAAGELKHGPLALVDEDMPVVAVAPNNRLLEKLKSNLEEVRARGGRLYVFADRRSGFQSDDLMTVFELDAPENAVAPILFTVPLQLLAYHCAKIKETDIDQPRNLAKSVTVE
ncbi:MAG: glutamine--fructose-6-phosphate transaminase (isomerizing) [Gammaproteobacteria bacterium]|nr:glutamine--fructose-6-phosphate transaminase (isomerizing) [Gammaproteobacteria bacterium]